MAADFTHADLGHSGDNYQRLQALMDKIIRMSDNAFLQRQTMPEFKQKPANYDIFRLWSEAAKNFIAHARNVYAYQLDKAEALQTNAAWDEAEERQNAAADLTPLLAAQYVIAYKALKDNFGTNNQTIYDAEEINKELTELCPNLLRFGTAMILECAQSLQPPMPPRS